MQIRINAQSVVKPFPHRGISRFINTPTRNLTPSNVRYVKLEPPQKLC